MMAAEFRWIQMSLFLILVLQFTAANGQNPSVFTVRDGDEVTLPCQNVIDDQYKCDSSTWIFTASRSRSTVPLFELGKIHRAAKSKSDRLSLTENCSLVIKKVTDEDVTLHLTDPERGVSYASISYTKKTKSKARVQGDDGEGGAVTYSTVKASSSSAGASIDPSNLYATIK
ncbi:uncharacterized protein AKAME5_002493600 [Lates japonicus]|uniref:Immunoglobulin subtype domain-containing protein n=1 Tax=Lates japonicus TaxID=270547 RepID=A0AAD3NM67_LATJO|nr:uncharacterized protein AKAME5_002493600 [Lates japonicus]